MQRAEIQGMTEAHAEREAAMPGKQLVSEKPRLLFPLLLCVEAGVEPRLIRPGSSKDSAHGLGGPSQLGLNMAKPGPNSTLQWIIVNQLLA